MDLQVIGNYVRSEQKPKTSIVMRQQWLNTSYNLIFNLIQILSNILSPEGRYLEALKQQRECRGDRH